MWNCSDIIMRMGPRWLDRPSWRKKHYWNSIGIFVLLVSFEARYKFCSTNRLEALNCVWHSVYHLFFAIFEVPIESISIFCSIEFKIKWSLRFSFACSLSLSLILRAHCVVFGFQRLLVHVSRWPWLLLVATLFSEHDFWSHFGSKEIIDKAKNQY